MKFKRSTLAWRTQFAEAAVHIWADRAGFFNDPNNVAEIHSRLRAGKTKAVRDIARELRARGVYSQKTALCTIERALLRKLFRMTEETDWTAFVRRTVGLGWLNQDRRAA